MSLGASELFLIVLAVLLLFGGKRLPDTARQLGRSISNLRRSYLEIKREVTDTRPHTPASSQPIQTILHAPPPPKPSIDSQEPAKSP